MKEERPAVVEQRERLGDWEVEPSIGKKMRKMKILFIGPIHPPVTGAGISNQTIIEDFPLYSPGSAPDFINTNALLLSGILVNSQ